MTWNLGGLDIFGTIKSQLMWILKIILFDMPYWKCRIDTNPCCTRKYLCGSKRKQGLLQTNWKKNACLDQHRGTIYCCWCLPNSMIIFHAIIAFACKFFLHLFFKIMFVGTRQEVKYSVTQMIIRILFSKVPPNLKNRSSQSIFVKQILGRIPNSDN